MHSMRIKRRLVQLWMRTQAYCRLLPPNSTTCKVYSLQLVVLVTYTLHMKSRVRWLMLTHQTTFEFTPNAQLFPRAVSYH